MTTTRTSPSASATRSSAGEADRGILICGSGVGASVAANKMRGIRAAVCHDTYSAHQGVEHDDMNVLTLGARVIGPEPALECAVAFLGATFSGEPRHRRRLAKVLAIEAAATEHGRLRRRRRPDGGLTRACRAPSHRGNIAAHPPRRTMDDHPRRHR